MFITVEGRPSVDQIATRVAEFTVAGATTIALHAVGDEPYPLEDFVRFVAHDLRAVLS